MAILSDTERNRRRANDPNRCSGAGSRRPDGPGGRPPPHGGGRGRHVVRQPCGHGPGPGGAPLGFAAVDFQLSDTAVRLRDDLRRALTEEGIRKVDVWTARHGLQTVEFPADAVDPFVNVNTPEEFAEAEKIARS